VNVRELIEILGDYPEDTEVEMGIIAPVTDEEQIAVDRYPIEGILPWEDDDEENGDGEGEPVLWLIGGEEEDVEAFLDAIEAEEADAGEQSDEVEASGEAEAEEPEAADEAGADEPGADEPGADEPGADEAGAEAAESEEEMDEPGPSAGA
jgi:hypothetical protein